MLNGHAALLSGTQPHCEHVRWPQDSFQDVNPSGHAHANCLEVPLRQWVRGCSHERAAQGEPVATHTPTLAAHAIKMQSCE
jgi:hypothetical protein